MVGLASGGTVATVTAQCSFCGSPTGPFVVGKPNPLAAKWTLCCTKCAERLPAVIARRAAIGGLYYIPAAKPGEPMKLHVVEAEPELVVRPTDAGGSGV